MLESVKKNQPSYIHTYVRRLIFFNTRKHASVACRDFLSDFPEMLKSSISELKKVVSSGRLAFYIGRGVLFCSNCGILRNTRNA